MLRPNSARKIVHPDNPDSLPDPPAAPVDAQSVLGNDYGVELFEEEVTEDGPQFSSPDESLIEPTSAGIAQMFENFHHDGEPQAPIPTPEPRVQPTRVPRRKRILFSGLCGAACGCVFCVTMWVAGFRTPKNEVIDDDGPALGSADPEPIKIDGFAAIAKALELAEARKYADAVMSIEKAPLANGSSKSSPEVLNRHELVEHWRVEERLHAGGYLSFMHRDAVNALERLLADYHKVEQQLREAHARLEKAPKPVDTRPLLQEIERLREAKATAESRAAHVDSANRVAKQALAQAKLLEERLLQAEQKLRLAEEKLKQKNATAPVFRGPEIAPASFPETVSDSRTAFEAYQRGLTFYRNGQYIDAEREFTHAVRSDRMDARYEYFLGLAAFAQGKVDLAGESFRRGSRLERDNRPSQVFVLVALEPVDVRARREVDRYRGQKNQ